MENRGGNYVKQTEEMTFAEIYGIASNEYKGISTIELPFSVRIINRLMSNGIKTAAALLDATPLQLIKIKGFGKTCLEEIYDYCASLKTADRPLNNKIRRSEKIYGNVKKYAEQIKCGDFSFIGLDDLNDDDRLYACSLKDAYDVLGEDLALACMTSLKQVQPIIEMLSDFQEETKPFHEIREMLWRIPAHRRNNKAIWYIKAFTIDDDDRRILQGFCSSEVATITEFAFGINVNDRIAFSLAKRFLGWCTFDLTNEIQQLFGKLYINDRARNVIELRAAGQTLEQVGNALGVTRERVRQIEMKVKHTFARLHGRIRIVSKIAAERNGDTILSPAEILRFFKSYSAELLYLLQSYEGTNYVYDKQLDVFIVGDDSLCERVSTYLETLPSVVTNDQYEQFILVAEEDEGVPREMFEKAFMESYRQTGLVYHRDRLTLATIYHDILNKYFQNGMHVYDPSDIKKFRDFVAKDYGNVRLPENDRALTARIAEIGILCGRGIYRVRKKQYIRLAKLKASC